MRIYLDHNATTPLRQEVVDVMVRVLRSGYGNPSSTHQEGADARRSVETAREQVAACLGARPAEILFTAGASEANNIVLRSLLDHPAGSRSLLTTVIEHPSVLEPASDLERSGVSVARIGVDEHGRIDLDALTEALELAPTLVSLIWANNETGVIQDVDAITDRAKARGALVHVDATQAVGKWAVDVSRTPVDFLSSSAHKLNGPKGVGCLFVREGLSVPRLIQGGPQERGRRGGTENTAGIAGYGLACALAHRELGDRMERYAALRDRLWQGLREKVGGVRWNAPADHVLPNTLNVEIEGAPGDVLLQALDVEGVAASAGAACHSGSITPSHVLAAMGRSPAEARASLRLSVGHGVDEAQVDRVIALLADRVPRARAMESR